MDSAQSISATCVRIADRHIGSSSSIRRAFEQVFKLRELPEERQFDDAGGTVSLLCDDEFSLPDIFIVRLVDFFTKNEHHDVRVLLDRSGLAKIGKLRTMIALSLLGCATQLRKRD